MTERIFKVRRDDGLFVGTKRRYTSWRTSFEKRFTYGLRGRVFTRRQDAEACAREQEAGSGRTYEVVTYELREVVE